MKNRRYDRDVIVKTRRIISTTNIFFPFFLNRLKLNVQNNPTIFFNGKKRKLLRIISVFLSNFKTAMPLTLRDELYIYCLRDVECRQDRLVDSRQISGQ